MTQLAHAIFCQQCEEIFDARAMKHGRCPRCGDGSVAPVSRWLKSMKNVPDLRSANGAPGGNVCDAVRPAQGGLFG